MYVGTTVEYAYVTWCLYVSQRIRITAAEVELPSKTLFELHTGHNQSATWQLL